MLKFLQLAILQCGEKMSKDSKPLAGQRILVTGASSGIGAATACLLGRLGAIVAIHYNRNISGALDTHKKIFEAGGEARLFKLDLLRAHARNYRSLFEDVVKNLGGLEALVNNAGGLSSPRLFFDLTERDWLKVFKLNLFAPAELCKYAFAHMAAHGGGRIVNISSIGVKYGGSPTSVHYAAAKSALETMTIGLAKMGAQHNILVNAIRPGFVLTPMNKNMTKEEIESRVSLIPLKRYGEPEEIAEMSAFLLSPAAAFITGQILAVSGGD